MGEVNLFIYTVMPFQTANLLYHLTTVTVLLVVTTAGLSVISGMLLLDAP